MNCRAICCLKRSCISKTIRLLCCISDVLRNEERVWEEPMKNEQVLPGCGGGLR